MSSKFDSFQKLVKDFYKQHGRHNLPWRQPEADGSFDAYNILVSEIMLQQTQVTRVIPKYQAFLEQFPDVQALAQASLSDILKLWVGLGYNRRAKYLHEAAASLAATKEPWTYETLIALPGIGPNTAGAILAYAYNLPAIFIETNIRTVFIHHFFPDKSDVQDREIRKILAQTLDKKHARMYYWALMDYGSALKTESNQAARRSKHHTKQSTFKGSQRQLRGQIIRLLTEHPVIYQDLIAHVADNRLDDVLKILEAERLIKQTDTHFELGS